MTNKSFPYAAAITSAAREDPPMPQRITRSNLLVRAHADNESNCGINSLDLIGRSTQFNRVAASVSIPQIVESFCAKRIEIPNRSLAISLFTLERIWPDSCTRYLL